MKETGTDRPGLDTSKAVDVGSQPRYCRDSRKDLPVVQPPAANAITGRKTKLTNHRAAIICTHHCGCYRETAAELANQGGDPLALDGWSGEPYETFSAWSQGEVSA